MKKCPFMSSSNAPVNCMPDCALYNGTRCEFLDIADALNSIKNLNENNRIIFSEINESFKSIKNKLN